MTSKDTDTLIILIYRYLKDNGYKKVATALRKHAPQIDIAPCIDCSAIVETEEEVKVSLSEIFKSWSREQKRHKKAGNHLTGARKNDASESSDDPSEPPDVQTPELSPAIVNAQSPKKPVKTNIRKTSASKKQMKKETVTKSRKRKKECSAFITPENDSDSDSSLDVDKWTKLLTQLSDSDIAKMEVLSNFVETPVSTPVTSAKKGRKTKQTKPKKETNSAKNEKSKTAAKKTKAKTDHIPVRTDTAKTSKKSAAISEGVKTPSKKARCHHETSDLNMAETPKTTKAKVQKHKPSENQTNGLMKTYKMAIPSKGTVAVGLSDSENVKTPKKVKVKSSHSLSEQVENHAKAVAENDSETSSSQTLSKKAQKKIEMLSESTNFKTPSEQPNNSLSGTKVKKKKNSSKLAEADCEDTDVKIDNTHLVSDQSETPSKKVKNKKLHSVVELIPSETPKKHKARKSDCPIDLDMAKTSDVLQESSNLELHERLSEAEEAETPSKKSKKAKGRKSQAQNEDDDNCGDGLDNEDTSSQDIKKHSKKRKHKREEANDDLAQEEATPEPKKAKKEKWKNKDVENIIEDHQQPSVEEPVEISQKKKKKKKDKERESDNTVSDDHPVSTATEELIVHKKKKKKKEKNLSSDEAPGLDDTQR
nr:glutamic acid-rich protein isoform X1 [Misgurnus anguillicaudatus]